MAILLVSLILALTLWLLISEKISADLTAIGIMVLLVVSGLLTPRQAVAGFANPAVITVGAMFIISRGLMRTGGVEFLARRVIRIARGSQELALAVILATIATASAFINNTPVVILFIPVVMAMCCEFNLSPSRFLIPVSYASILAGTCTLIGTSTNIIISDLSAGYGFGSIGLFELAIIGVPIATVGLLFLLFAAPRIMPSLANPVCRVNEGEHRQYLAELEVLPDSPLVGQAPQAALGSAFPALEVLELVSGTRIFHPERDQRSIAGGDILLVKGTVNDLVEVLRHEGVTLPLAEEGLTFGAQKDEPVVVELIVSPHSALAGQRLSGTSLIDQNGVNVIAVKRSNLHYSEKQLRDIRLRVGDILLIWTYNSRLAAIRANRDYLLIEEVHEEIIHKRKAWLAMLNFIAMVATASLGLADIMTCALAGAFVMIITGCLSMRDSYRALQGEVLLLIAGTIALGTAMENSGASRFYAKAFLGLLDGQSTHLVLGGLILLTSISTQLLSNNATAVLLMPIAVNTALGLGVDPKPFIIGICFGASACFATPMGYQTNLMVYGPGGYRFKDYLKLGLPLNGFVVLASTLLIPLVWPFTP